MWLRRLALLVLVVLGLGSLRSVSAQSVLAEETRYTVALIGIPLTEALDYLIEKTQLGLIYESHLIAGKITSCKAERVPAEQFLRCVLQGTGLDFVRLSSGTYVLIRAPEAPPRYASLTGLVRDSETGMPLAAANVVLLGERLGTATNQHGRFAFANLRPGPHRIVVTHVAYHDLADSVWVEADSKGRISVAMQPRIVLSSPVVVSGFEARLPSQSLGVGRALIDDNLHPRGVGTPDVVQDLGAVVGVHLGNALSDVHVQGGDANEQRFLLDGAPVFVPVSNGGFIGPFSPYATGHVTVQKAGFGAAHGSGLSGVIEMEHQLSERPSLMVQIDPLSANTRWTGKVGVPERIEAVWMVAARKGLWDFYQPSRLETLFRSWGTPDRFLLQALQPPDEHPVTTPVEDTSTGVLEVGYSDIHASTRVRFGGLRSLNASFYRGGSTFGLDDITSALGTDEDEYQWTNLTGKMSYEWVQSARLFANASLWLGSYALEHPARVAVSPGPPDDFNEIAEVGGRLSGDFVATSRHYVSGALEVTNTESDFSLSLDPFGASPARPRGIRPAMWRLGAFAEDRLSISHRATLLLGMRLTYLPNKKNLYAEPRLSFRYDDAVGTSGSWAFRAALGLYRQYLHSFDVANYNVTSLLPRVRFWLPIGREQRLPEAYHATTAALYQPGSAWEFGIEAYYKHQPHLLVLDYGDPEAAATSNVFTNADGYAYGFALKAKRQVDRLQATGHYEYAVTRRRIQNRFDGAFVPVPWDAPHRLYLAVDVAPLRHLTTTVRWQGIYGRSWGFRQAYYDYLEPTPQADQFPPFNLSDPAAHQLPAFSQLDLGLAYTRTLAGVGLQTRLAFINLLGRHNVTDWSLRYDESTGTYLRQPRQSAPFIPSFSLRLSV